MNTLILTPEAMFQGDLLLVNPSFPHHPLPHPDLVTVADTDILLERRAAQALDSLMAAIGGWKEIVPVSGWRALEEQQAIWEDSLAENGLPFTQTYVAYPGHSEHQTGLAIDLGRRSASTASAPLAATSSSSEMVLPTAKFWMASKFASRATVEPPFSAIILL